MTLFRSPEQSLSTAWRQCFEDQRAGECLEAGDVAR